MAADSTPPTVTDPRSVPPVPLCDIEAVEQQRAQRIWDYVSASPLRSLWDFQGAPLSAILKRTWKSLIEDDLVSRAAELGFYFFFALFPTLVCASSILGLAAREASTIYIALLQYLAYIIPPSAYAIVLQTFNQTAEASTSGKITLGLIAALWTASVGFSAIQDTLNIVYNVRETRPYWRAHLSAILVTGLLAILATIILAVLFGGDYLARSAHHQIYYRSVQIAAETAFRIVSWIIVTGLLILLFALIYYFAPDVKNSRWHWLTPGAALGILGWVGASMILRLYLRYFNTYSLTYGSLGAVIILLTWFYLTGLMLLIGAELNSEIEAAATEKRLHQTGEIPPAVTTDPEHPIAP